LNIAIRRDVTERNSTSGTNKGGNPPNRQRRHEGIGLDLLVIALDLLVIAAVAVMGIAGRW
jgi:hypothetical protein